MLAVTETVGREPAGIAESRQVGLRDTPRQQEAAVAFVTREANELLFEAGDLKTHLYRLEEGMLYLFEPPASPGEEVRVVGFALPGDIVGLGRLKIHSATAQATQACRIGCLPLDAQQRIADADPVVREQLHDAIEQEFEFLRRRIVAESQRLAEPLSRLAALLVTFSRNNVYEGRDPLVISDDLRCGTVAHLLGLDIDTLARLLLTLEERGIVVATGGQLAVLDLAALEDLAGG